jgi:hypothetical protein
MSAFGPWQLMFVAFGWILWPLMMAGIWCYRLASKN